jgi:hypothetical protein
MQVLKYPSVSGKRWHWHQTLLKEWLQTVDKGISERKYAKWLRTRKVFDRGFVKFACLLLGIEQKGKQAPVLNDVGKELVEELGRAEVVAAEKLVKLEAAALKGVPRSRSALPPPPGGEPEPAAAPNAFDADDFKPATADDDPFLKALLERFTELNSYLTMFVFKEIGDGFLAPPEAFRRIGTNDFLGKRPSMPDFEAWVGWMEWLGGLNKVGFRHKFTQAGLDVGAYLIELPAEELLGPEEPEEPEEPEVTAESSDSPSAHGGDAKPASPALTPNALGSDDSDDGGDEFDDDEFDDDELDLPPSADGAFEPYWKSDEDAAPPPELAGADSKATEPPPTAADTKAGESPAATAQAPAASPTPRPAAPVAPALAETTAAKAAALRAATAKAAAEAATQSAKAAELEAAAAEKAAAVAAAKAAAKAAQRAATQKAAAEKAAAEAKLAEAAAQKAASEAAAAEKAAATKAAAEKAAAEKATAERAAAEKAAAEKAAAENPVASDPARAAALRLATSWWLKRTPPKTSLSESGVAVRPHPSGKPVSLFKLLTLATLLEPEGPRDAAVKLFEALEKDKALEAMLVEDAPLDRVLKVAWQSGAPAYLEERLVHLLRYRRGLADIKASDLGGDARAVARMLQDKVSGPTLGPGLIFVLRELSAAGAGPSEGLDGMAWLPSLLEG